MSSHDSQEQQEPQLITDKRKITSKINAKKAGLAKLAKRKSQQEVEQYSVYEQDDDYSEEEYSEYTDEESDVEEFVFKPKKKAPKAKPIKESRKKLSAPERSYEKDVVNRKIDRLADIVEKLLVSKTKKVRKPYSAPKPARSTVVQILPANNSAPVHNPVKESLYKSMIEV
jgi:hypothetical protein